jgi:hypothetical protein
MMKRLWPSFGAALFAAGALVNRASACSTCFGAQDSAQTKGMNMAILGLLVIIGGVLAAFVTFFLHLARRSHIAVDGSAGAAWPTDVQHSKEKELVS